MASDELIIERDDGLAVLRLNRPERLNAISAGLIDRLAFEVPRLMADRDVRAIMLTGEGRAFCAGGDVGTMQGSASPEATLAGMRAYHGWLKALRGADKLVLTAVNGVAAGGGFGLALIGDLVLASEDAFFKTAFTSLGVAADFGLAFTLPRAVGQVRAAEILFNERRITAREGLELGFVGRVLPADTFAAEALEVARALARTPFAAQLTKRLLRLDEANAFERFLEAEAQVQSEAFQSADFREGVAAFTARRTPVFRGR